MGDGLGANLFVGVSINEKLQEMLDNCEPHQERFFKRNDPEYLQLTTSMDKNFIGKRLEKSLEIESLENVISNVMSILKKICPDYYFDKGQFVVFTEISIG